METSTDYSSEATIKGNYTDRQKFLWIWYRMRHHAIYSQKMTPKEVFEMGVLRDKLDDKHPYTT